MKNVTDKQEEAVRDVKDVNAENEKEFGPPEKEAAALVRPCGWVKFSTTPNEQRVVIIIDIF